MPDSGNITESDTQEPADPLLQALPRSQKVILVIDLVESVRLMAHDEAGTVARWHAFVQHAQNETLPAHHGRLVKSLGDGLMVEFEQARDAVNAAQALHQAIAPTNADLSADRHMNLRAGINSSQIYTDKLDVYGAGVNLAARLATLAGPGETVVSATVRDDLTDGLDTCLEDLGECYLKHLSLPVRAFRAGLALQGTQLPTLSDYKTELKPTVAIIPFVERQIGASHDVLGEMIADVVIHQMGKSSGLRIISRFSSTLLRDVGDKSERAVSMLGANYLLEGNYFVDGQKVMVSSSLIELSTQSIVWHDRFQSDVSDLFQIESEIGHRICEGACSSVLRVEVSKATTQPLPTMQSHSLMLGSISLMHRASKADFLRSRTMLDRLHELHRHHAQPLAWLGKWYVLQLAQGWSSDPKRDATEAMSYCRQALDLDSHSSLALSITGQVLGYLRHDLIAAEQHYQEALLVNPNETLAWLWSGMNAAFRGISDGSVSSTERAMQLSPIDPLRYYYQSLAASTATCTGQYDKAIVLAKASIRINRTHASTYRALAIAQALSGQETASKETAQQLLLLDPQSSVQRFLDRYPAAAEAPDLMNKLAEGLRIAGLPE